MKTIQLTQGLEALVDDEDYENIAQFRWHAARHLKTDLVYAQRTVPKDGTRKKVGMHNVIMGVQSRSTHIDHINGDTLDNRRSNLRLCSHAQNIRNKRKTYSKTTSVYKGVSRIRDQWLVQVNIGSFRYRTICKDEVLAAKIYDVVAAHYHGEFARINGVGELLTTELKDVDNAETGSYYAAQ